MDQARYHLVYSRPRCTAQLDGGGRSQNVLRHRMRSVFSKRSACFSIPYQLLTPDQDDAISAIDLVSIVLLCLGQNLLRSQFGQGKALEWQKHRNNNLKIWPTKKYPHVISLAYLKRSPALGWVCHR